MFAAYDFTFARQLHGAVVPYGEAGDCYSLANCPQGESLSFFEPVVIQFVTFLKSFWRQVQHQPDRDRPPGGGSLKLDRGGQQALSVAPENPGQTYLHPEVFHHLC